VPFYRHGEDLPLYPPGDPRNAVAATQRKGMP
jgi:hypothetical protein